MPEPAAEPADAAAVTGGAPGTSPYGPVLPSALVGVPLLPVRPWRPLVTVTTFVAAVLAAAGGAWHLPWLVIAVGAASIVGLVVGWVPLLALPSPRGTTSVLAVAAVLLTTTGWLCATEDARHPDMRFVLVAMSMSVLAEFVHQLSRRDGRPRLVESVSASVSGILLIASWSSTLPYLAREEAGPAILAVCTAVACAALADVVRGRWVDDVPAIVIATILASAGAGVAANHVAVGALPAPVVWVAGAVAGVGSYALRQVFFVLPTQSRRRPQIATGAASMLLVGVVIAGLVALA